MLGGRVAYRRACAQSVKTSVWVVSQYNMSQL